MFHSLRAGLVNLSVLAPGYITATPGQRRPGGPSPPIVLADGERLGPVSVRMWKYAAIEGRVVDERGEPLVRRSVRALRREWSGGQVRLTLGPQVSTDDRGTFRLWSLVPGDYFVVVPSAQITMPVSVAAEYQALLETQTSNFLQTDLVRRLNGSNAPSASGGGMTVGGHVLQVGRGAATASLAAASPNGRLGVFPVVVTPALDREPIRLSSGEQRQGIEAMVRLVPASSVSGVATGPDGSAVPYLGLRLVPTSLGARSSSAGLEAASTVTDAAGRFTFLGVPEGSYTLTGLYVPRADMDPTTTVVTSGGTTSITSFAPAETAVIRPNDATLFVEAAVMVGDEDVTDVGLRVRRGLRLVGSVEFEGTTAAPAPEQLPRFSISLRSEQGIIPGLASPTRVNAGAQFETHGHPAGRYFLTASSQVPGWTMASAMWGGKDISQTAVELDDSDIQGVVVTFSDRRTEVRGVVRTTATAADPNALVLVVPADTRAWITGGMNPRLTASARTNTTGVYVINALPPGDYRIVALSEDVAIEARDPAFIEQVARQGVSLSLRHGEQRTQDLRTERTVSAPLLLAARPVAHAADFVTSGGGPFGGPFVEDFPQAPTQPQRPVRDAQPVPATGTAAISGVVSTEEAIPKPVRRATVQLSGVGLIPSRVATTDDEGRFVFRDLPEGRFSLSASKPPFVDAAYGATRQGRSGAPIALTAGQHVTGVSIRMIRGAVIEGTVRDEFGRPAERAQVVIVQRRPGDGALQLVLASGTPLQSTDDRGMYRFYGLPPGDYIIGASNRSAAGQDLRGANDAEMQWAAAALKSPGPLATPPAPSQSLGSAPVYFPGVSDPADASPITVAAGEERTGADFTTMRVPTARVTGRVVGPDGGPARSVQMNVVPETRMVPILSEPMFARPLPDGSFSLSGVPPGRYVIAARASSIAGGAVDLYALHIFEVNGRDVTDATVMLERGVQVRGRVVFEASTATPPKDVSTVTVRLNPSGTANVAVGTTPANAAPDSTFVMPGVAPNDYRVSVNVPGRTGALPTWVMKSVVAGGRDLSDVPLRVLADSGIDDLVITLTDRVTEITGLLTDAVGRPAPEFSILVFPVDRTQWGQGSRRRLPATRPASDGRYRVAGLPPGEYFMVALTEIDANEMYDVAFLESLIPAALKFALAEGEKKVQDLKLSGR